MTALLTNFFAWMSKMIFVLRHAQSAGKQGGQQDYDRVLTPSGEENARTLGKKILKADLTIDLILASSAIRTKRTAELVNESLGISEHKILLEKDLYEGIMANWMDNIHALPEDAHAVLLVGHNPWLSMLASNFAGNMLELAPCEFVGFEFSADSWKDISYSGKKVAHITP